MKPKDSAHNEWYEGDDSIFLLGSDAATGETKTVQKRRIPGQGLIGWVAALWTLAHNLDRR